MEINTIKEQYPDIANIIRAVQVASVDNIGFYTSKLAKDPNKNKIEQWVKYWTKRNVVQAALIVNELKNIDEDTKKKLKQIIFNEIDSIETGNKKYYQLMLILLYFKEFEKAEKLYRYISSNDIAEIVKIIDEAKEINRINELVDELLEKRLIYEEIIPVPKTHFEEIFYKEIFLAREKEEEKKIVQSILDYDSMNEEMAKTLDIDLDMLDQFLKSPRIILSKKLRKFINKFKQGEVASLHSDEIEKDENLKQFYEYNKQKVEELKQLYENAEKRTMKVLEEQNLIIDIRNKTPEELEKVKKGLISELNEQSSKIQDIIEEDVDRFLLIVENNEITEKIIIEIYQKALKLEINSREKRTIENLLQDNGQKDLLITYANINPEFKRTLLRLIKSIKKKQIKLMNGYNDNLIVINTNEFALKNINRMKEKLESYVNNYNEDNKKLVKAKEELDVIINKMQCLFEQNISNRLIKEYKQFLKSEIQKLFDVNDVNINALNNKIFETLLEDSDYRLIFEYIYIVEKCNDYHKIEYILPKMILAPKEKNKDLIIKIVNKFIEYDKTYYAFEFLENISIKNYLDYMPKDKTALDYIEIIRKKRPSIIMLYVQKQLFFEEYFKEYQDELECTKKWIKYLEANTEIKKNEIVHEMILIMELLNMDMSLLDNDSFILQYLEKISNSIKKYNIVINNKYASKLTINVLNRILCNDKEFAEIIRKIKIINYANIFKNSLDSTSLPVYIKEISFNTQIVETKQIFTKLIENINQENAKDLIYIYMNTHLKAIIPIEILADKLFEKNLKNIIDLFNEYNFYGRFSPTNLEMYYRFKIHNVLNLSRTRIRKSQVSKFNNIFKNIYKLKISGYDNINKEILIEDINIFSATKSIVNNEIQAYIASYMNEKINMVTTINKSEFNDIELTKIIETQVDLLKNISPQLIQKMKKDNKNPYRFINYEEIKEKRSIEIIDMIEMYKEKVNLKTEEGISLKEKFHDRIKEELNNGLRDEDKLLENIIFYYMNSVIKYILDFDEFIEILVASRFEEQEIVNIETYFEGYPIFYKDIKNNKDNNFLNIICRNLACEKKSLKGLIKNDLTYKAGIIKYYNKKSKQCIIEEKISIEIPARSEEYLKLLKIFNKYIATNNFSVLEELKSLKKITELSNERNIKYSNDEFLLKVYINLYYRVVVTLINDLKKLKLFIEYLGANNCWTDAKFNKNKVIWVFKSNKSIPEAFIKKAKVENIEDILYCYNNTFLKINIPLDELLKNIFKFNKNGYTLVKRDGKVDLSKYNIVVEAFKSQEQASSDYMSMQTHNNFDNLKVIMTNKRAEYIEPNKKMIIKITQYDVIYNILYCRKVPRKNYKTNEQYYNFQYLYLCMKILKSKYDIDTIYNFFQDKEIICLNYYYSNYYNEYIFHLKNDREMFWEKILYKKMCQYFNTKEIKDQLNNSNINKIFNIYNNSILRYCVQLPDILAFIMQDSCAIETLVKVKIIKEINKGSEDKQYEVNFQRYRQNHIVRINNIKEIDKQQEYIVKIKGYDAKNKIIFLDICEYKKTYTNTSLCAIVDNINPEEEGRALSWLDLKSLSYARKILIETQEQIGRLINKPIIVMEEIINTNTFSHEDLLYLYKESKRLIVSGFGILKLETFLKNEENINTKEFVDFIRYNLIRSFREKIGELYLGDNRNSINKARKLTFSYQKENVIDKEYEEIIDSIEHFEISFAAREKMDQNQRRTLNFIMYSIRNEIDNFHNSDEPEMYEKYVQKIFIKFDELKKYMLNVNDIEIDADGFIVNIEKLYTKAKSWKIDEELINRLNLEDIQENPNINLMKTDQMKTLTDIQLAINDKKKEFLMSFDFFSSIFHKNWDLEGIINGLNEILNNILKIDEEVLTEKEAEEIGNTIKMLYGLIQF